MSSDGSTLLFGTLPAKLRLTREEKRALKKFLDDLCNRVANGRPITCLITGDRALQRLNAQFLDRNHPTDVLSFPSGAEDGVLGDLAISIERAATQAAEFSHTRVDEIRILMLHGVLHLMGFDHERDRGEMAQAEEKWCVEFGLPLALTQRAGAEMASL